MTYDHEANILLIELTKDPIVTAKEFGNFIIHLSKTATPVLIEILDASKFMGQFDKLNIKELKKIIPMPGI